MTDALKQGPDGWWLPEGDTLFENYASPPEFRGGPPPKRNGFYREHLLAAFKHVRAWGVAVDVGAHCGYWTYEMAQRFGQVHAFEPSGANYACLVKNLACFENVDTYQLAVGERRAWCEIRNDKTRPGNSGSNYIMPGAGAIEMVALDALDLPGCDFLKIDVEGYELRVLQGAIGLIRRYRPVISLECTDEKFRDRYGIPVGEAQRWLLKRGYREVWHQRPDKVFVHAS
jgi:FkbM family methyltransferase